METSPVRVHYSSEREDYYVNLLGASAVFRMNNERHLVATTVKHISIATPLSSITLVVLIIYISTVSTFYPGN